MTSRKKLSVEEARSILREYPDADMSAFDIVDSNGVVQSANVLATEEANATLAKIREIAGKGAVLFAEESQLDSMPDEYNEFMGVLKKVRGISPWFSDLSHVGDVFEGREDPRLALLAKELGVSVASSDSVVEVCLRLRARLPATD